MHHKMSIQVELTLNQYLNMNIFLEKEVNVCEKTIGRVATEYPSTDSSTRWNLIWCLLGSPKLTLDHRMKRLRFIVGQKVSRPLKLKAQFNVVVLEESWLQGHPVIVQQDSAHNGQRNVEFFDEEGLKD